VRGWTGGTLSHFPPPFSHLPPPCFRKFAWKNKMKNKSGQKSVFLYIYYLWSTFLKFLFLKWSFSSFVPFPFLLTRKIKSLKLFIHICFGGDQFSPILQISHLPLPAPLPPTSHPLPPTSLPSFHLPPPFLPPPLLLSAPSQVFPAKYLLIWPNDFREHFLFNWQSQTRTIDRGVILVVRSPQNMAILYRISNTSILQSNYTEWITLPIVSKAKEGGHVRIHCNS